MIDPQENKFFQNLLFSLPRDRARERLMIDLNSLFRTGGSNKQTQTNTNKHKSGGVPVSSVQQDRGVAAALHQYCIYLEAVHLRRCVFVFVLFVLFLCVFVTTFHKHVFCLFMHLFVCVCLC